MTTPMMQQFRDAKNRHPGMLLFFRNGDFYELFHEDAEVGARLLGLRLTKRDKDIPMAGFPHHQLEAYLKRLLAGGHRVAVCDQVEDPSQAKGIIRREVTRVVTPGTLTEDEMLDPRQTNHLVCVAPPAPSGKYKNVAGVAWVELSTGHFQAADLPWDRLADELGRLAPSELLHREGDTNPTLESLLRRLREAGPPCTVSPRPEWTFDAATCRGALHSHFAITTLAGFGFEDDQPCVAAAGALLLYLKETLMARLGHLSRLRPYARERYLFLDEVTRRALELTRTLRDGARHGSLLAAIDRTVTPMGARLLQGWLLCPLAEKAPINARLDAVGEFLGDHALRSELRAALLEASDLQRLTARVSTGRASPRDLRSVSRTLGLLPRLKARVAGRRAPLLRDLDLRLELCPDLREVLEAALVDDPPQNPKEGGIVRRGYDKELDELHEIASSGKNWIAKFQADEVRRTGIPSLKVGFNQVFGYYIEVTNTHQARIPADYQRKQTLKNCERYITPALKEQEEKVLSAQEKIYQREYDLFLSLRERVAGQTTRLLQTADVLAQLDALAGLAELAAERNYCRPELTETHEVRLKAARHPVLDQFMPPGTFVPNDVTMSAEDGMVLLVTGPNMGGKSTLLRSVAQIVLLAQMGSYVPAKGAVVGLADRVFTRMGAADELTRAQSTFMVEMTEAANILNNATARSLVVLDEIGRGTSTYDGVSLAWAITEYLHDSVGCRTLFATHYHELAELSDRLERMRNYNALVKETAEGIVFLHRIAPGSADKSYGIHVAQRAGVPQAVLERAQQVLAELESHHVDAPERPGAVIKKPRVVQGSLFADSEDPILQEVREFDVRKATAEEVRAAIARWQRDLGRG